ncbi:DUF4905 domain-containing protein [Adhaeribacter pallidiroseus]|uniref:DUF4905 domain-containing protein n=1 Tax=Adhaeribacter pallidiroseus TaxID=2072847 RepID=A0A369QL71_9BACT|nr:DUF4905 domain-containing protein [Adhaeribacter pallidiroseus]RDC64395.1 hypothetical protein AHMF7616_03008 [Adhaeribacter pallidiroseus]
MLLRSPQKQFSITFQVPIWQIRPDFEQELLAVELRDGDRLQTEFVVLDAKTGLAGVPYQAAENWWVGLEETSWRLLFLHGFADRKVGAHVGITTVSVDPQQILWQHEEAIFYGLAAGNKVLAQPTKLEKEVFIALDAHTGAIVESAITREQAQAVVTDFTRQRTQLGRYPVHYAQESEYFNLLSQFVLSRSGRQVVGAIDYLEAGDFLFLSYYEAVATNNFKNVLGMYAAADGALVQEEILNNNVTGLGTGSFFVMNNTVLFITEKSTLVAYNF